MGAGAVPVVVAVALAGAFVHLAAVRALFPAVWADLVTLVRRILPDRGPLRRLPWARARGEVAGSSRGSNALIT